MLAVVNWSKRHQFIQAVCPDVTTEVLVGSTRKLRRLLPQPHPDFPWLYCVKANVVKPIGFPDKTAGDPAFSWKVFSGSLAEAERVDGYAEVRLTFRNLPFAADVTNTTVDENPSGELLRFVARTLEPAAEATIIGGSSFRFVPQGQGEQASPIGNESPAKIVPNAILKYRWEMVPRAFLPTGLLELGSLGLCNWKPFDQPDLSYLRLTYPPGTLLFLGCTISDPYRTVTGVEVVDLEYMLQYRPRGWYMIYRRARNGWREVTASQAIVFPGGGGNAGETALPITQEANILAARAGVHPYDYSDFNRLFQLS